VRQQRLQAQLARAAVADAQQRGVAGRARLVGLRQEQSRAIAARLKDAARRSMEPSGAVVSGALALELLESYHALWEARPQPDRNPATQPVSLERDHFARLRSVDYVVSDKSDGVRYVLYLAQAGGQELAVLVDRKLKLYQVPVAAARKHFRGSIFDGELVNVRGTHVFLVFDAVAHKGSNAIARQPLTKRLELIRAVFDLDGVSVSSPEEAAEQAKLGKVVCGGSAYGLSFRPKPCFQLQQLDTLLRRLPLLPYAVDGLIFTPQEDRVVVGTHETMFKLKWKHSIDVEVGAGGALLVGLGGAPETAVQRVPLSSLSIAFEYEPELAAALPALQGRIVELALTSDAGALRLSLLAQRPDKAHPNTASTVLRTVKNVREDITPQELLQLFARPSETGAA